MREHQLDRLIREKLQFLALPFAPDDWGKMTALLDRAFDHRLRSKLRELILPLDPEAWPQMVARLDEGFDQVLRERLETLHASGAEADWPVIAALLADQPFDALLLKRLLTLQVAFDEEGWQQMARLLDDDVLLTRIREALASWQMPLSGSDWPEMSNLLDKQFDQSMQSKLDQLIPSEASLAADWAALSADLDGGTFDQSLREQLESLQLPALESDWDLMAEQLDAPFDLTLRQKLAHQPAMADPTDLEADWVRLSAAMPASVPAARRRVVARPRPLLAAAAVLLLFMSGAGGWWLARQPRLTATKPVKSTERIAQASDSSANRSAASDPMGAPSKLAKPTIARNVADENAAKAVLDPVQVRPHTWATAGAASTPPPAQPLPDFAAPAEEAHEPLHELKALSLMPRDRWALASPYLDGQTAFSLLMPADSRPPEMRIGLIGSLTRTKAELSGPNTKAGYLAGLRIEMVINPRWQVVTGMTYGVRRFSHTYYTTINEQSFPNALDGTMRLVAVPLMIRYQFPSESKLSLYLQGGVVTLVGIEETYNHYDPSDPANKGAFNPVPRRLKPKEQAWSLNTYPGNVEVALGLEYALTRRVALQLEPSFQQSLQRTKGSGSLGVKKKLYTAGLSFGTVIRLSDPQP